MFGECSYSIWLHFDTKRKLISIGIQVLYHFVYWHVKCVEKVPFRKSGHIYLFLNLAIQEDQILYSQLGCYGMDATYIAGPTSLPAQLQCM